MSHIQVNLNKMKNHESDLPRVWLLLGDKLGDNTQVRIIAEALGLPYEIKRIVPRKKYIFGKPRFRPTLRHLDMDRSDILKPPWPELVMTIGRRPAMAALWVKRQSKGVTKVVLIGRPRRGIRNYALVIVPPQYIVPKWDNIISLDYPLVRRDQKEIEKHVCEWRDKLQTMTRPITAVFVGGPTKPFLFDEHVARDISRQVTRFCCEGSIFVVTSRRTPKEVADALQDSLNGRALFYRWGDPESGNPYIALLGSADRFVVTGDSISMMTEVACVGKPLFIYPLPSKTDTYSHLRKYVDDILSSNRKTGERRFIYDLIEKYLYRPGYFGYMRDITIVHDKFIRAGYAAVLGDDIKGSAGKLEQDLGTVVQRLRVLMEC